MGQLESVDEHRVEVLVKDEGKNEQIRGAVSELKKVSVLHPPCYVCSTKCVDRPIRMKRLRMKCIALRTFEPIDDDRSVDQIYHSVQFTVSDQT